MKILELTRSFYPSIGGMEKFVDDRLKIYQYLDYEYQVITTTHSEKKLDSTERLNEVKYLPSFTPYEIVPSLKTAIKTDYDILSVNQVGYFYSDYAISNAYKKNKKIILTPHFYFHTDRYKYFKGFHFNFILPNTLKKIDKIICFTEFEAEYWVDKFPFVERKIEIIPHYFKPSRNKADVRLNEYNNYLLFLGRGEKNKRIDLLIPAFNKIETGYQLLLTITRDEISSELNKIVDKNSRIHLLGRVPEEKKQNLLKNCTALVLPTDYEAFGIVNFEASYYKKPLLLTELEIFKSILNSDGIIYFKNNLEAIEKAISKIISTGEKGRDILGTNNYLNLSKYSFEKISKKYAYVLDELF